MSSCRHSTHYSYCFTRLSFRFASMYVSCGRARASECQPRKPAVGHQRRRESGGKLAADCTWSTWGAGPRPQNSRQKENPGRHVPPYGPGHSCEDIGQLSRNPMQPISRRRGHPRCSGNPDARGCVVRDGGAPFYGRFPQKNRRRGRPRPGPYPCRASHPTRDLAAEPGLKL